MGDNITVNTPLIKGWMRIVPALGAFLGGVSFPATGLFAGIDLLGTGSTAVILGCALGAALGDLILHLFAGNFSFSSGMIMDTLFNALFAGGFAIAGAILAYFFGGSIPLAQYLIPAISALGLYFYSMRRGY
jgi:hypothetical protein